MPHDLSQFCIPRESTIRKAIECIDANSNGIALVCDEDGRLIGTITDGDIRRALLTAVGLDAPIAGILREKKTSEYPTPVTASVGIDPLSALRLMHERCVRQLPLLDGDGRVCDLWTLDDLVSEPGLPIQAVVMAGGQGIRLRPLTEKLPKPMLPVGDKPLLQRIIEQMQKAGIRRVHLATHYKGEIIENHFRDGRDFGMEISYIREDRPLGTAGALCRLEPSDDPLLVVNGDILSLVDFRAMLDFHRDNDAVMTVAVREYTLKVPYGIVQNSGLDVTGIVEKPEISHLVNAAIYMMNKEACRYIPDDQPYDMPDLIARLIEDKHKVVAFLVREYWQDIGRMADYQEAVDNVKKLQDAGKFAD